MKKILIIDTFNFLHRAYHALPKTLTNKAGEPTNAIYGVTSMLISVFDQLKPDCVMAALDGGKPTFRLEQFTGYKAHRRPMEDGLSSQIPKVLAVLDAFGLKRLQVDGYEADDIIATFVEKYKADTSLEIVIVSNDRDLWQLVEDNVLIMVPINKKGVPVEWIGPKEVVARMSFTPELIVDYKALRGDPSDNIPGVYGIGDKTAKSLISQFGTVEEIYQHLAEVEPASVRKKLAEGAEQVVMSKNLAQLIRDVPLEVDLEECVYTGFDKQALVKLLADLGFRSLIKRLGLTEPPEETDQLSLF